MNPREEPLDSEYCPTISFCGMESEEPLGCVTISSFGKSEEERDDLSAKIRSLEMQKARDKREARKQRARELTKLRELELKNKGVKR